jgi:hypothetical protein
MYHRVPKHGVRSESLTEEAWEVETQMSIAREIILIHVEH